MNSLIAALLSNLLGMFTRIVDAIFYIYINLFSSICSCELCDGDEVAKIADWSFVFLKRSRIAVLIFLIVILNL